MPWKHWPSERLGVALAILAALGFSFKAIFVKNSVKYTKKMSHFHA